MLNPTKRKLLQMLAWLVLGCLFMQLAAMAQPWQRFAIDDSLRGADGVRLADANGDGFLDIVSGWEESGQTRAYFHPGKQLVQSAWPAVTIGLSPSIEDAVWVDLNGDGQLDVLSSCEGEEQSLRAFMASPGKPLIEPETWKNSVIGTSQGMTRWMFATPFPIGRNQLGPPDIVVGSKSPNGLVGLLHYSNTDAVWHIRKLVDAKWIMSLQVLDLDGDKDLDILYSDRKDETSGVFWMENLHLDTAKEKADTQHEAWRRHLIGAAGQEVMFIAPTFKQARGDSAAFEPEIFVAVKPNHIYRFSAGAAVTEEWRQEIIEVGPREAVGTAKGIARGDLDSDGVDELVFSCEGAVAPKSGVVYLKRSAEAAPWTLHDVSGPEGSKFDLVELVDLDFDGDLDILTCEERHAGRGLGVIWYANPFHSSP